jgi:hypothetical protein
MSLLDIEPVARLRRIHGLEHATIHVLQESHRGRLMVVGRSDLKGFTLYGEVNTSEVEASVDEALRRLKNGEHDLAVHPRCGTTLATTGIMAGLAAFLALGVLSMKRKRFRWTALPEALTASLLATIVAQPLGMVLQERVTTAGDAAGIESWRVIPRRRGLLISHRVEID